MIVITHWSYLEWQPGQWEILHSENYRVLGITTITTLCRSLLMLLQQQTLGVHQTKSHSCFLMERLFVSGMLWGKWPRKLTCFHGIFDIYRYMLNDSITGGRYRRLHLHSGHDDQSLSCLHHFPYRGPACLVQKQDLDMIQQHEITFTRVGFWGNIDSTTVNNCLNWRCGASIYPEPSRIGNLIFTCLHINFDDLPTHRCRDTPWFARIALFSDSLGLQCLCLYNLYHPWHSIGLKEDLPIWQWPLENLYKVDADTYKIQCLSGLDKQRPPIPSLRKAYTSIPCLCRKVAP